MFGPAVHIGACVFTTSLDLTFLLHFLSCFVCFLFFKVSDEEASFKQRRREVQCATNLKDDLLAPFVKGELDAQSFEASMDTRSGRRGHMWSPLFAWVMAIII
jgi:hypothetical protein